jgi:hypothetical protein
MTIFDCAVVNSLVRIPDTSINVDLSAFIGTYRGE